MELLNSSTAKYPDWTGWTLVQPCISVGHVGQLAVDVLITSLRAQRITSLYHPALYPVAGVGAYDHVVEQENASLNTSLEVYACNEKKVVLMQQRSPCIPGRQAEFCNNLKEWIEARNFQQVVILSSLDSQARVDMQLQGDQFRYVHNSTAEDRQASLDDTPTPASLKWPALEAVVVSSDTPAGSGNMLGSGLAKRLLTSLTESGIATTVLLPFCQPGMQCREALMATYRLNQWLHIIPDENGGIRWPKSWDAILPGLSEVIPTV
ncbi:proteasome assembly chaperone 2-like [Sycon ciliatum]|uniref:proteasome assembly chaperone 2-like n=1 Tax=Sycon ciliatum TaxID=27933 RepID=UPI0020ADAB8E|eukprot:scpid66742/ scgid34255/ Proteasome assembly chaperone 2